jgi:hypothetical protein
VPLWARAIIAVAAAKTVIGLSAYLSGVVATAPAGGVPVGVYALLATAYTLLGGGLVIANRGDVRAEWLGGILVLIGTTLTPVVNSTPAAVSRWITDLRPDAFSPAFLWFFIIEFPSNIRAGAARSIRMAAGLAGIAAAALIAINLSAVATPPDASSDWRTPWLRSTSTGNLYWPLVLGFTIPAFPIMLVRGRSARPEERQRVQRFLWSLLVGFAPFAVEVVLEELIPAYKAFVSQPAIKPVVAFLLFVPLSLVPFATAYAVLYDAVMDVRVVLRAALQYALARYAIIGTTVVPFVALAIFVIGHRDEPIVSLMTGPRPILLSSAAALGLVALSQRDRWLLALDRRYFRDAYDAQQILTRFVGGLPAQSAPAGADRVREELESSLHANASVFLLNEAQTSLRDVDGQLTPLAVDTPLVGLVLGDDHPMDIDVRPGTALGRLSEHERAWLAQGPFVLVAALRRAGEGLSGLVALTAKQSGLPYSTADRRLVSAVGAAAGLALDNLRLRTPLLEQTEPAARECLECSRLNPPETPACACGGALIEAAAPHMLRGIFRLEQRIGAGGMGVVYRAADLALGRTVAIKTLPRVSEAGAVRLRREARAMASLTHPNLAVIYGLETWQGIPCLVEEYLGGGTLGERLAGGPFTPFAAIDLGCTLAAVLAELHTAGVVHCDIKPSNIGFTSNGVVKLLDFGLSRLLRGAIAGPDDATQQQAAEQYGSMSESGLWRGTPFYMSPEAARGERPNTAFDVWALSVVLFEAISGRRPFDGRGASEVFARLRGPRIDIRTLRPDCPSSLAFFFNDALALDPVSRPPSALALLETLAALRAGLRVQ